MAHMSVPSAVKKNLSFPLTSGWHHPVLVEEVQLVAFLLVTSTSPAITNTHS